jgi:hypothetical protein
MKISSREITLSKNHWPMINFKLDLHNLMMYPSTKFEINVCNSYRDDDWKPMMTEKG